MTARCSIYRRFLCLVGTFLCFSGLSYGVDLSSWDRPNGCNVDEGNKTISFNAGNYTFTDAVKISDDNWKLLGVPSNNGEILSILDGGSTWSFFKFHKTDGNAIFAGAEWLSFKNGVVDKYSDGGAIYANNINGNIANSEFISNTAGCGGAVKVSNAFIGDIFNSAFRWNTATWGGAIDVAGYFEGNFEGNILSSIFGNNEADYDGGALCISAFTGNIANTKFISNTARQSGGAVYVLYNWLCAADNLHKSAANLSSKGDALFLGNKAGQFGGAVYVDESANVYAAFGDMIFQGNMDNVDFDKNSGQSNAMCFGNDDNNDTVTLSAFDVHFMRFYDPISSNVDNPNLIIRINGALAEKTAEDGDPEINGLGTWAARQTGTVLFDWFQSNVYFGNTTVSNGTMALHNGAIFGASDNVYENEDSTFTLEPGAVLRIAYEQERREYILEDGAFDRNNPNINVTFSAYEQARISAI
ncbi:MAG: hypothetical protein LBC42_00905, partial [Puniceicoccales bacterium]|nr:hypothetical protein [Puniceicoccales bacterium]